MIEIDCADEHSGQLEAETLPGDDPSRDGAVYWVWANPDAIDPAGPFGDYADAEDTRTELGKYAFIEAADPDPERMLEAVYKLAGPVFGLNPANAYERQEIAARLITELQGGTAIEPGNR